MRSRQSVRCWMLDAGYWIVKYSLVRISFKNPESRIQNPVSSIFLHSIILILLSSCSGKHSESVKFQQYYVQGEQLYTKHCSNCHQANGSGLGLVFPPLNQSDFMDKNFEQVLCLMKHGIKGEITVNGKTFVQPMPGVQSLTDLEIAEIATYIYNSWDHKRGIVDVSEANRVLSNCKTE